MTVISGRGPALRTGGGDRAAADRRRPRSRNDWAASRRALFHRFPYGLVLVGGGGDVLALNERSAEFLGVVPAGPIAAETTCCELICDHASPPSGEGCLTRRTLEAEEGTLDEVLIRVAGSSAWVTTSKAGNGHARVVFHLRPSTRGERGDAEVLDREEGELRIHALGRLRVETAAGTIDGDWLQQRPGQLLKYLVCERTRPVANEQIAEALWPDASQREALTRARQYVHQLRLALEPDRTPGSRCAGIATRRGGYALARAWVDADEFERRVQRGLGAVSCGALERARLDLDAARRLYRGDFLAEDPYAEWALAERDRLRELASRALYALVEIELAAGSLEVAAQRAGELAAVDPFDVDVWRRFLELSLRLGRRSEAVRQYALFRNRVRERFGEEPGFTLSELAADAACQGGSGHQPALA